MKNLSKQNRSVSASNEHSNTGSGQPNQPKPRKKKTRKPYSPMSQLTKLVNELNAHIDLNDRSNDQKINVDDYSDQNSPHYIDKNDTDSIKEEQSYLQNRIYKLSGDKRYVPDYEDAKQMNDTEFMEFIGDIGMEKDENGTGKVYEIHDKTDDLTDDEFTDAISRAMKQ